MKAELQEVMNKLRRLQGAIDFSNAPAAERDELAEDVAKIMDELFDLMKSLPDSWPDRTRATRKTRLSSATTSCS